MLALRDTSKITLLTTLIIMVSAAGAFAKARQGGKSRNRSNRQPQQAKQPQAAPGQAAQSRGVAPQNPRNLKTTPTKPQAMRKSPVVRQPVTRRNITPQGNTNVSARRTRTITKTIAPKTPVVRRNVVSPRPVNREVKTVTRTELKRTVKTIAPTAPAKQPVSRTTTTPTPIRRRTEVRGKPLTKRRQSTPIRTNPVKTPAKETSPDHAKKAIFSERAKRQRPAEQKSRKVTERAKTKETVQPQRKKQKVLTADKRINHADRRAGYRQHIRMDRDLKNKINRPKVIETTSRKRDGLHGGHNIYHDRRVDRQRVSKTTIVIGDTSHGGRNRHGFRHHKGVHGRRPGGIFSRVVWPSYHYRICYDWGPRTIWRYVRPRYHRKYVFVSIGGYWPLYYRPLRYCWYSYHPFVWYGAYPTAYKVTGDTFNYYTYNTYVTGQSTSTSVSGPLEGVDETTFEDVRQRLAEQAAQEPEPETLADKFFEEGVEAFEEGDYEAAAKAFADATALEPNDLVMPFAYAQALFADEQYYEAAEILRLGLVNLPPDKEGIFFPRGLYADDEILFEQIEQLKEKTEIFSFDADYKFLLGYQYIGVGEYDQAEELLAEAAVYERNTEATEILLRLLGKIKEII